MTPAQTAVVAVKSIEGVPGCTIAQSLGVHPSTITRTQNKPAVKAFIEAQITELMHRGLKPARRTLCRLAALGNRPTKDPQTGLDGNDKDILSLALKASQTILQHANPQPGTVIYNLTQINQAPEQAGELSAIELYLQDKQWAQDAIDVSPDDTNLAICKEQAVDENNIHSSENLPSEGQTTGIAMSRTPDACIPATIQDEDATDPDSISKQGVTLDSQAIDTIEYALNGK